MTAVRNKKKLPPFPRAKIARIVEQILPKGKSFEIRTEDSGLREKKIVSIVTAAWKNLRPPERIFKVLDAVDRKLSDAEQERILYFSVLTPNEYRQVVLESPTRRSVSRARSRSTKKLASKRKPIGKAKQGRAR
jgi:hypothetical protein